MTHSTRIETQKETLSRRAMLCVGGLGPMGLSLSQMLFASRAHATMPSPPRRAKRCLMIFLWGGPSHQDLWDLKPDAPDGIRGEFAPQSTSVPGIQISELLPNLAAQMDKLALIRSVTHTDSNHSTAAHWMLTGRKHQVSAENFSAKSDDAPHVGSIVTHLDPASIDSTGLPTFIALPERIATTAGAVVPGQSGGWLGKKYDPFRIDQHPDAADFQVPSLALPQGVDLERYLHRWELSQRLQQSREGQLRSPEGQEFAEYHRQAIDMITSRKGKDAFDLSQESDALRDRYQRKTFGQSLLMARRLLEAGVKLVTVYWHRDKPGVDTTWDTHGDNFGQLRNRLCPQVDGPIATLLEDLQQRGMLDDTLVVWNSEFGRTPKVNKRAGRDHWGACNSVWLAGGGVPGGQVYGASDANAAYPSRDPVAPSDIAATILYQLGISPNATIYDPQSRPHPAAAGGSPIMKLLEA